MNSRCCGSDRIGGRLVQSELGITQCGSTGFDLLVNPGKGRGLRLALLRRATAEQQDSDKEQRKFHGSALPRDAATADACRHDKAQGRSVW